MSRKRISNVWKFVEKFENNTVQCKKCSKIFRDFGNTTNLLKHFKAVHPLLYTSSIVRDLSHISTSTKIQTIGQSLGSRANENTAQRKKQLQLNFLSKGIVRQNSKAVDKALLKMICLDFQSLEIVESTYFQEFTAQLNRNYELPSKKILSEKLIPEYYNLAKEATEKKLQTVNYIAITTDFWTSYSNKSFLTLTMHFIFQGKSESLIMSTKEMKDAHTSESVANAIREVLDEEWNILNKVVCIVSHNAAHIKKAVEDQLQKHYHPCIAHTFNLAVQECLIYNEGLSSLTGKCRAIVTYFENNSDAVDTLQDIQRQMNVDDPLELKEDVQSQWNSLYIMLKRFDQLRSPLSSSLSLLSAPPDNLTTEEWNLLHEYISILKPLEQFTAILSTQQYPSMSSIIPLIQGVQMSLKNCQPSTEMAKSLQEHLMETIEKRLGYFEANRTAAKATFIDPRFKKAGFGINKNADFAQNCVVEELAMLECLNDQEHRLLLSSSAVSDAQQQQDTDNPGNLWDHLDLKVHEHSTTETPTSSATMKVNQYVELPYMLRNSDPLTFWEVGKEMYGGLYKISQKYLCIPATCIPAERIFYNAGQLWTERRNRLERKMMDQILFLNSYLSAENE